MSVDSPVFYQLSEWTIRAADRCWLVDIIADVRVVAPVYPPPERAAPAGLQADPALASLAGLRAPTRSLLVRSRTTTHSMNARRTAWA